MDKPDGRMFLSIKRQNEPEDSLKQYTLSVCPPGLSFLKQSVDALGDFGFGNETDRFIDQLAIAEEQDSRDAHDAKLLRHIHILVNIEFSDLDTTGVVIGYFIDNGTQPFARTAPGSPAVNDGDALSRFGCKILICKNLCHNDIELRIVNYRI